jgi:redox-sensitive bicupin YhaK (pirin superfamily)
MPSDELLKNGGLSEGFQLWVNLPKAHKMARPRYQYVSTGWPLVVRLLCTCLACKKSRHDVSR